MTVIKNVFWLFVILVAIGWLWEILEIVFYGAVQPRKVDEIISFVWMVAVVLAYKKGHWDAREQKGK